MSVYANPRLNLEVFSNAMYGQTLASTSSSSSGGTITGVSAGTGLSGGGNTGTVSLAVDTNTIAQKSYVDTSISSLVDSAPGTLNTLNELAAALNDDHNYATTISNHLGELDISVNLLETTSAAHTTNLSVLDISVNLLETTSASHTTNLSVLDISVNSLETTSASHTTNLSVLDISVNSLETTSAAHTSNLSVLDISMNLKQDTLTAGTNITITNNQISATSGGTGDVLLAGTQTFTGVNTFDDNIKVETIETKSTSDNLILTNTSSSTDTSTSFSGTSLTRLRQNQKIAQRICDGTSFRVAKGSSDYRFVTTGYNTSTSDADNYGKYTIGKKNHSNNTWSFDVFTASGTAGFPLSHTISMDGKYIAVIMDGNNHDKVDIYETDTLLSGSVSV